MNSKERDPSRRAPRLFGGTVLIILGVGQFVFAVSKYGALSIFVGTMAIIAGLGLLYFGFTRS
jgi:uncharacterized membrane protein HdeD (DUF308 family)